MISASLSGVRVRTVPPGCRVFTAGEASTLRRVMGSSAGPSGPSAKRSTTPNGAAANLASGGIGPVRTVSGKLSAFCSGRPASSLRPAGKTSCAVLRSGRAALKRISSTLLARASPGLKSGSSVVLPLRSTTCFAQFMGTGALKFSCTGRIGRQAACALGRSQLKVASNGGRTLNFQLCGWELVSPPGLR